MKTKGTLREEVFALVLIALNAFAYASPNAVSGAIPSNDLIIGGTDVNAGDPVAASTVIVTDENTDFICSGSLIAEDMVVTAAHCVDAAKSVSDLRIVFSTNINDLKKGDVAPIIDAVQNPKWKGDASKGVDQGDIAIIGIDGKLPAGYHPATLLSAEASDSLKKGDVVTLAGYGVDDAEAKDGSDGGAGVLRQVQVDVAKKLGKTEMVLNQTQGGGACHGDSGGPAFVDQDGKLLLWGLTNRSYPNSAPDDCAHEVVYTRIADYSSWISQVESQIRDEAQTGDTDALK